MVHTGIWMFGQFKDADFDWDIQVEAGNSQKATHFLQMVWRYQKTQSMRKPHINLLVL